MVYDKYCETIYSNLHVDPSRYLTLPSFSYDYIIDKAIEKSNNEIYLLKDFILEKFIRNSVVGGRCFVQKSYFQTQHYDEFQQWKQLTEYLKHELYSKVDDSLVDLDTNSLYPSAMKLFKYPIGVPDVLGVEEFDRVKDSLNSNNYKYLSIVECDMSFTNVANQCTPLVSVVCKEGNRIFDFTSKKNIVLSSVDIEESVKYNNARIDKMHNIVEWKKSEFLFKESIENLFELRKKNKTNSLGHAMKLYMNSSYGKMIMKIVDSSIKIFDDNDKFEDCLIQGNVKGFNVMNETQVFAEVKNKITTNNIKNPSYLGVFILFYSKRIMNTAIHSISGFTNWNNTFYYTDTDSMIIKQSLLEQIKNTQVKYDTMEPISLFGDELGQMHNDLDLKNSKIIKGIWIRPKCYILEYIGYDKKTNELKKLHHVRSKGINTKYLHYIPEKELIQTYEKLLHGESQKYENIPRFQRFWKDGDGCGIKTVYETKEINKIIWKGRTYDSANKLWKSII